MVGTDNPITIESLTPVINSTASMTGYVVDAKLKQFSEIDIPITIEDFGITILMLNFAKYYCAGQYPLFVHTFQSIVELDTIETYLLAYNQKSIHLLPNLATHERYGLKSQGNIFNGSKHITMSFFDAIHVYMRSAEITPEKFIEHIKPLHINIVESFYIFTSITKNCKVINECHDLIHGHMKYTFHKPIKSLRYDGHFWFEVPPKSIWFAYLQGKFTFSSFAGSDTRCAMDIFKTNNIQCLVVGFVSDSKIYPIIFEDPQIYGDWEKIIKCMQLCGFNCALQRGIPTIQSNVYFVKNNTPTIFKLEKLSN